MKQVLELPQRLCIQTPLHNLIMEKAMSLKLSPESESDSALYGVHTFGLVKLFYNGENYICLRNILGRILYYKSVGRPVWSYLFDEEQQNIPEEWKNFELYFGDIFVNEYGDQFLVKFLFETNIWIFKFQKINGHNIFSENARFVCLAS